MRVFRIRSLGCRTWGVGFAATRLSCGYHARSMAKLITSSQNVQELGTCAKPTSCPCGFGVRERFIAGVVSRFLDPKTPKPADSGLLESRAATGILDDVGSI